MQPIDIEMDMAFWAEISKILAPLEPYTFNVPPAIAIFLFVLMVMHLTLVALHERGLAKERRHQENRLKRFTGRE